MNFLQTAVQMKRMEIDRKARALPLEQLKETEMYHRPPRSLEAALRARKFGVIAEVKKASPSRGVLRADWDPIKIGTQYQEAGASAISVVTDKRFFDGRLEYLSALRSHVGVPLLRKDFVIDRYQLHESRSAGADAVLLIVAALECAPLRELMAEAVELGLEALVEVHNEEELRTAVEMHAPVIGVNNRDLGTLQTSIETSFRLGPMAPAGCMLVSESGITSADDLGRLRAAGFGAALVGEYLIRQEHPGEALKGLLVEGVRREP